MLIRHLNRALPALRIRHGEDIAALLMAVATIPTTLPCVTLTFTSNGTAERRNETGVEKRGK